MGIEILRNNLQMVFLLLFWLVAGVYTGPAVYIIIPFSVILLYMNNRLPEIFIGFLFLLVISDSLEEPMEFAKSFKNAYILLLSFLILINLQKLTHTIFIYKYFIPYFIFALIGIFYSPVQGTSIQKLLSYVLLFVCVPNYVSYCYQLQGKDFFKNLIYFMLAIVVAGFLLRFIWADVAYSHGGRLRGIFGNPNGLGIFMIVFFLLYVTLRTKYPLLFNRTEHIIILIVILYITYKTGSRASLIAIILYYFFSWMFNLSVFAGLFSFFVVIIGAEFLVMYFPQIVILFGLESVFRVETLEEGSGRLIAWQFAWINIKQNILLGRGLAFDEYLMRSNYDFLSQAGHEGGVHNTYLIMWLNTGLLGLLSFLYAFILLFIKAFQKHRQALPIMFAIMLSINFEPWLSASLNPYTIIYLVIITILLDDFFDDEVEEELEENTNEEQETTALA